ncbi:hypothetical protein ACQP1U_01895 [Actinomycetota bacterium]
MRKHTLAWSVALALIAAAAYAAFLGWDDEYQTDPVTGQVAGPYAAWQVIGLALVIAVTAAVAGWHGQGRTAVLTMPVALTLAFIVSALLLPDETGLFLVGALLMLIGSLIGVAVAAGIGRAARRSR